MYRYLVVLLLAATLSGCATWQRVDASNRSIKGDGFAVEAPTGWVMLKVKNQLFISKDGPALQRLHVIRLDHDKAFPTIKEVSSPGMLPAELAERYIAESRKSGRDGLPSFELISNRPVTLDGNPGFEIVFTFKQANGLEYTSSVTGFAAKEGFYAITYSAPSLHYYPLSQPQYLALLESFRKQG